jgi:cold shock CspA family protein
VGVHSEIGYREVAADREEGVVAFFDLVRGYGFVTPAGADPADKSAGLYLSIHALKRAGISLLAKGDRIEYRKEASKYPGRKPEAQDIRLMQAA